MHTQVWTLCRIPGQKWKHITVWWRRTLSWQLCYCRWPWYPQFHTSAPDILRMMASLGFRSFLDSPIFWSIEIDMQGYHSTGVNLACDLNLTAPMFCMKHQWGKHSNTYDLRQHLGRRHRHICCFPDHIQWILHFGAWSSCLCVFLFSSWRICPLKMSLFSTEFTKCILSWKLVTEWTSSLHQTQDFFPSDFLLSVFGLGLNCFSLYQFLCNPPISFFI